MRCECCDKLLSNREATSRFFNTDPDAAVRYTNMCAECQSFLPPTVKIVNSNTIYEDDDMDFSEEYPIDNEVNEDDYEE